MGNENSSGTQAEAEADAAKNCPPVIMSVYNRYKNAPLVSKYDEKTDSVTSSCGGQVVSVLCPDKTLYYILFAVIGVVFGYIVCSMFGSKPRYTYTQNTQPTQSSTTPQQAAT